MMIADYVKFYNQIRAEYGDILTNETIEKMWLKYTGHELSDDDSYSVTKSFDDLYPGMYNCEIICKVKKFYENEKYNKITLIDENNQTIYLFDFNKTVDKIDEGTEVHIKNVRCGEYKGRKTLYTTDDTIIEPVSI